MCGIFGVIGTRWRDQARSALASLESRGPDQQNLVDIGDATFGHARLSVVDLALGHQPMQTPDGRYTIVFNGEIYNAPDLRRELQSSGEIFLTDHSDTEVLLLGFRAWGLSLLSKLDGMFAFAIWDEKDRSLFAARDRLGIKPFMYSKVDSGFIFSSTLEPFLNLKGFPLQLDFEALRDYLAFQTPLAPHSMLSNVRQLQPAHYLRFRVATGDFEIAPWWAIPSPSPLLSAPEEMLEQADSAIQESVRRQLMADVPLGAFLSGGIDSSLLVSYLSKQISSPVKTFSMTFSESAYDESQHARAVARIFGCEHHEFSAPQIDGAQFADAISRLDQPLADPAYVMTYALSKMTRGHVTVAISGDGGDELFGGYSRYKRIAGNYPSKPWQFPARWLVEHGMLPSSTLRRTLSGRELLHYQRVEVGPWPGRKNIRQLMAPDFIQSLVPENTLGRWLSLIDTFGGADTSDALMRADLWTYLSENCLTKTDRASMAFGLEVRVPLLGQPVVDFALGLPANAHLAGGFKRILTDLAKRDLPESVWNREKHGFSVPLDRYFRNEWSDVANDVFSRIGQIAPFLNADYVSTIWRRGKAGKASKRLVYTLLVLLLWLDRKNLRF